MNTRATLAVLVALLGVPVACAQAAPPSRAAEGKAVVFNRRLGNCLACHTMQGSDVASNVGPLLFHIKQKFPDRNKLFQFLWNPESSKPQSVMPAFGKNMILDRRQIEAVIDFLYTL